MKKLIRKSIAIMALSFFSLTLCGAGYAKEALQPSRETEAQTEQHNPFVTYDYYTGEPIEPDDGFSSDQ